jgi:hypothetical protein
MDGSSKETEENLMFFHDNTDENRPEMNEQNVSETSLASKQHGSVSEIDKVTDKTVPRPPLHEPGLIFNPGQHATGGYFFILFT